MSIFQHKVFDQTQLNGKAVIDLGCGRNKLSGAIGVDCVDCPGVDYVSDLNEDLPFENESFEFVYTNQVLEHIPNMIGLVKECHRILQPGGKFIVKVPYFRSSWAAIDPTHIRMFSISSMNYFVEGTYENENYRFIDETFSELDCYLDDNYPPNLMRWIFTKAALKWPYRYENSVLSFFYPFESLTFVLKK